MSADWDADAVRDDVRDYVVEHLGDPFVVMVADGAGFVSVGGNVRELRADAFAKTMSAQAWKNVSAGVDTKGPHLYHWAHASIRPLEGTRSHWLLVRRSLTDPEGLAYYLRHGPEQTALRELVRVAGARWAIEETFQTPRKVRSASTSTRSAATTPGTATSP